MENDCAIDVEECDDDDIYGDLESDIFLPLVKKRKLDEEQDEQYQAVLAENQTLKDKLKQLERDNKAYSTNISALYLTAKSEIDKKNYIIKTLQEKLKNVTKSKSSISNADAEEIFRKCQEAFLESQAQITIDEIKKNLKNSEPSSSVKRKHVKFGNMSVYFFREQGTFVRGENVLLLKNNGVTSTTSEDRLGTTNQEPSTQSRVSESISTSTSMRPLEHPTPINSLDFSSKSLTEKNTPVELDKRKEKECDIKRNGRHRRSVDNDDTTHSSTEREIPRRGNSSRTKTSTRKRDNSPSDHKYRNNRDRSSSKDDTHRSEYIKARNARWADNNRATDRTRSSNRFVNDSRHSSYNKRHRSRSRSR